MSRSIGGKLISIVISVFLGAVLLPVAISELMGVNQTGWGTSTITMWGIIPVMIVLAFFLLILRQAGVLGTK